MSGARFLRADLHVHTYPDDGSPADSAEDYVRAALLNDLAVIAITDHNTTKNVDAVIDAAAGTPLYVVPGIEITTHQGHVLALFSRDKREELTYFASPQNLKLAADARDGSMRSSRSLLDLTEEIASAGGLAVAAHIDADDGIASRLSRTELEQLFSTPDLAAIEFRESANLAWFSDEDADDVRRAVWRQRESIEGLQARGLARLMSSDAHKAAQVGVDRSRRSITRLRLDDTNWTAIANAVVNNPRSRCKPEPPLPTYYPRILRASFTGGFLDGTDILLNPNLNCFIGGRGSGKSTALIAIRTALGATVGHGEDPDDPDRMPEETIVTYVDTLGNERVAVRRRGEPPQHNGSPGPVQLSMADLGQDESGELARGYRDRPELLLDFLDRFCDLSDELSREQDALDRLAGNRKQILANVPDRRRKEDLEKERSVLNGSLQAAERGKVEAVAEYARLLGAEGPLLDRLATELAAASQAPVAPLPLDLARLAREANADLTKQPAAEFVNGPDGLVAALEAFHADRAASYCELTATLIAAATPSQEVLARWRAKHDEFVQRLKAKEQELRSQGLTIQAGELARIATRLRTVNEELTRLEAKETARGTAVRARRALLTDLVAVWDRIHQKRRAMVGNVVRAANESGGHLQVSVTYRQNGIRRGWTDWLRTRVPFKGTRLERLASCITPMELVKLIGTRDEARLRAVNAKDEHFFDDSTLPPVLELADQQGDLLDAQVMRLEDRPEIEVREPGGVHRSFDHLSAGQQRSVLLSLLLCADRFEPLVVDQPEDHLDAAYISHAIVHHLEQAKERRQVILATHSANLAVLGDAELIIPMTSDGRRGAPQSPGAVDRPETMEKVCALLEGGLEAYQRRGHRYGLEVRPRT